MKTSSTTKRPAKPQPSAAPFDIRNSSFSSVKSRHSSLWRDNYNPLRSLTIARLTALFEAAERGDYAELQLLLRKVEKRYPVLKALQTRRLSALQKLGWSVKTVSELPAGATAEQAAAQKKFLEGRYELVSNLREAFGQIALSDFRGYAILQKHRYTAGANDGAVSELYWLEPWCFSRDGFYGDFFYNEDSKLGVGLGSCAAILGEANRLGSETLPRTEFVIRETDAPMYEIVLTAFVNWLMGRRDYAAFMEVFGLPNAVVVMPPNVTPGNQAAYQSAAENVAEGISGTLPNGADVHFPGRDVRGESPFIPFCDAQDKDVVLAGTGGLLTMLALPTGIGSGASQQHADAFTDIARADALKVSEVLQRDFDRVELATQFPGQPALAYFELATPEDAATNALVDDIQKLAAAGYRVDPAWLTEQTGYEVTAGGTEPEDKNGS